MNEKTFVELQHHFKKLLKELQKQGSLDIATCPDEPGQAWDKNHSLFLKSLSIIDIDSSSPLGKRLEQEFFGLGPLVQIASDPEITEVIINGITSIWFEKQGRLQQHSENFLSELTLENFVHRLCHDASIKIDLKTPTTNGTWNQFRVHIVRNPLTSVSYHLTLRKHPESPWTFSQLKQHGWGSERCIEQMHELVKERKNFLIIGTTGSGKTSVLNACLQALPPSERVVCIEDTSEVRLPNSSSVKLLTRQDLYSNMTNYCLTSLLKESLRMRPDRIVMGEVRGAEAKDLLLALATGHKGSMGTLHASHPRQALLRLEMLIQLGAPDWNTEAIRQLIHLSLDAIVVLKNENGRRQLEGIYRITSLERIGLVVEKQGFELDHFDFKP